MRSRTLAAALCAVSTLTALVAVTLTTPAQATGEDPARPSSSHSLHAGEALVAGTAHSSLSNGWYSLSVYSGIVELDETIPVPGRHGTTSWETGTWFRQDPTGRFQAPNDRTRFQLLRNGDLELVTAHGRRLWHSNTDGSGGVELTLTRGGNLTLQNRSGKVVWASHSGQVQMSGGMSLEPGQRLRDAWETAFSGGSPVTLEMQRSGNLVYRCGSKVAWQSRTHVPGSALRMYRNGVLRIVGPKGRVVWSTHSAGNYAYTVFNAKQMWIEDGDLDIVWNAQVDYRVC